MDEVKLSVRRRIGRKLFKLTAGLIIAVGFLKLASTFGSSEALTKNDPVFGMKNGQLMIMVGVLEIAIGIFALLRSNLKMAVGLMAMLATNLLIYRIGLAALDFHGYCHCLGTLTDAVHIPVNVADSIMKGLLALLLLVSYGRLLAKDFEPDTRKA